METLSPPTGLSARGIDPHCRLAYKENATETKTPPWLVWTEYETLETVPAMQSGKSVFLVTGDAARNKEMCLPGGGSATIKIELPKAWDRLMSERGYPPLKSFHLKLKSAPGD